MKKCLPVVVLACTLGACSWFGSSSDKEVKPAIPGKRISVLNSDVAVTADAAVAEAPVRLPPPQLNTDWPQAGGRPDHAMHHLDLGPGLAKAWSVSIGSANQDDHLILSAPVIAGDKIFTLDGEGTVAAFERGNGNRIWKFEIAPPDAGDDGDLGGGVTYDQGSVFVGSGFAEVLALSAEDGKLKWRKTVSAPVRTTPTATDGRVFVLTVDNQLHALSAEDGHELWTHEGLSPTATMLGGASPAVAGDLVVVAYSSGELFALKADSGFVAWSDTLQGGRRTDAISSIADIRGRPVIDRGVVYAVSNDGMMVAVDLRTGGRIWQREIGSIGNPWVAGEYIYLITNDAKLICLLRKSGQVRWIHQLEQYNDPDAKRHPLVWNGPVLAGDRLVVTNSRGYAISFSPYTGQPLGHIETPDPVLVTPVVADKGVYFVTTDADLVAYR